MAKWPNRYARNRARQAYNHYWNQKHKKPKQSSTTGGGRRCVDCIHNYNCPKPSRTGNHADCFSPLKYNATQNNQQVDLTPFGMIVLFFLILLSFGGCAAFLA